MLDPSGRVAATSGASAGIGRAIAVRPGAKLLVNCRIEDMV
jgi:NAD(P)-dependent dehydrogenase (short-subunit alcohol dehydrogenase family)